MILGDSLKLNGSKILVVDDSEATRKVVASVLKRQGFDVEVAGCGNETLSKTRSFKPDLILLDIDLNDIDGFKVCKHLKHDEDSQDIPIIFLTGHSDTKSVLEAFNAGGCDYIAKPFNPVEALARIESHIKVRLLMRSQKSLIGALQKASESKSRMIGIASHDLRGPLGSITELTRLVLTDNIANFNHEQSELVQTIHQATESMLGLVENLLDISIIDAQDIELKYQLLDLAELIRGAAQLQQVNADKKAIQIHFVDKGLDEPIDCDRRQIRRVVDNLLSNAVKYSPHNTAIEIETNIVANFAVIQVIDNGPGIPLESIDTVFDEFTTTTNEPTGGEISTGLGLSICKRIVEAHGGKVSVRNQKGGGCCFQVEIPTKSPLRERLEKEEAEIKARKAEINQASLPNTLRNTPPPSYNKIGCQG